MPRKYRHIGIYGKELKELKSQGLTHREIGERLGFTRDEVKKYFERERLKQRRIAAEKAIHQKGRPCKKEGLVPPSIQKLDKLAQMRYVMASKDRYIKRLEMENELMRDFLSLTERK